MAAFATVNDITLLKRKLTAEEQERASALLDIVSDFLRAEADKVGKNLDDMVRTSPYLASVAQSIVVEATNRALNTPADQEPMSQMSQTAGPFTASATYLVPGGGVYILRRELALLGLRRQKMGVLDIYGIDSRTDNQTV